jgi:putative toxin-antitoxin system antitoxin component (TIGR02293 family)
MSTKKYAVMKKALEVFGDNSKALDWLNSPCYSLGDRIPMDLLNTSRGCEIVLDTLNRIEYGVFG